MKLQEKDSKCNNLVQFAGNNDVSIDLFYNVSDLQRDHHTKHWNAAESLRQRLNSIQDLLTRRRSLIHTVQGNNDATKDCDVNIEKDLPSESSSKSSCEGDTDIPLMDEVQRQSLRFQNLLEESERKKHSSKNEGQRQVSIRDKRRQKRIHTIEKQLENNSSSFVTQGEIIFNVEVKNIYNGNSEIQYPIPFIKFERNAVLLLQLSCEKIALDNGRDLMKAVCTNPTSIDLFINMFWFIYCQYFQVHSDSAQNCIQKKISTMFPKFIELISSVPVVKQRDILFRHYPFVLSKGINLCFQYLFPDRHYLIKGPFLDVLYRSLFRVLTGITVSPEFINSILLTIYPEDVPQNNDNKSDKDAKKRTKSDCYNPDETIKNSDNQPECALDHLDQLNKSSRSKALFTNPKLHESFQNEKLVELHFDVNQISPLLQQCLGRDGISLRPKHFIKRTVSMRHSETSCKHIEEDDDDNEQGTLMQRHMALKREMKTALLETEAEYHKAISKINREKSKSLKSHETIQQIASQLLKNQGRQKHYKHKSPIT